MPFIGNQPALAYTSFAVQHFTTSATTSYTLDYPVANENEIRLVINNVVQQPGSSYAYTASGTSLTLSAATTGTDTMYAVFLGKAVQTVTPPANSITNTMLAPSIITGQTAETSIAGGDQILIYDDSATALRKMTRTNFVAGIGGTNTPAFKAQVTSDQTGIGNNTWTKVTYNNEIFDTNNAYDPTTNYRFTVPSGQAGKYLIIANADIRSTTSARSKYIQIYKNGSSGGGLSGNFLTSEYFQNDQANQVMVANVFDLAVSDYIEIYVNSYSGGDHRVSGGAESYFLGFKLL